MVSLHLWHLGMVFHGIKVSYPAKVPEIHFPGKHEHRSETGLVIYRVSDRSSPQALDLHARTGWSSTGLILKLKFIPYPLAWPPSPQILIPMQPVPQVGNSSCASGNMNIAGNVGHFLGSYFAFNYAALKYSSARYNTGVMYMKTAKQLSR
jgi:hypothetical protein